MTTPATPQARPLDTLGVNSSVSPQTRKNRSTGGRKAALFARRKRESGPAAALVDPAADVPRDNPYGPEGSHWGSAPIDWDFGTVLARVRAAAERQREMREQSGGG